MKIGDEIKLEYTANDGMRYRSRGTVQWLDTDGTGGVMNPISMFAYHPDHPNHGRNLPVSLPLAFNTKDIAP